MGVAGSGKSTVGAALARRSQTTLVDADTLHSRAAVEQMRRGHPLSAGQRDAWIARLVAEVRTHPGAVVACSALKREHRDRLRSAGVGPIVWLEVPIDEVVRRLTRRRGHFVTTSLLASQVDDLEVPSLHEGIVSVDGSRPVTQVLDEITAILAGPV